MKHPSRISRIRKMTEKGSQWAASLGRNTHASPRSTAHNNDSIHMSVISDNSLPSHLWNMVLNAVSAHSSFSLLCQQIEAVEPQLSSDMSAQSHYGEVVDGFYGALTSDNLHSQNSDQAQDFHPVDFDCMSHISTASSSTVHDVSVDGSDLIDTLDVSMSSSVR